MGQKAAGRGVACRVRRTDVRVSGIPWTAAIGLHGGTAGWEFRSQLALLTDAALGVVHPNSEKIDQTAFNGVLGILHGINPADEIEAMLASQVVGLHLASTTCMRRAQLSGQTFEARDMNLKHASKLSRTPRPASLSLRAWVL